MILRMKEIKSKTSKKSTLNQLLHF